MNYIIYFIGSVIYIIGLALANRQGKYAYNNIAKMYFHVVLLLIGLFMIFVGTFLF